MPVTLHPQLVGRAVDFATVQFYPGRVGVTAGDSRMKRMIAGTLAVLALGACATTPKGRADFIVGTWTCETVADGINVSGVFDYQSNGVTKGTPVIDVNMSGMAIKMTGALDGTWEFLADGSLKEVVTGLKVQTASQNGNTIPPAMVGSMMQPMVDQMIVGQESTSTPQITATSFVSTDKDGTVTTCKR